jgi:hypothetical protein
MARASADDDQEKPLDPAAERLRKRLIRFMVINFGLLFLALMVVIGALVYKMSRAKPPASHVAGDIPSPAGEPVSGDIVLPVGAKMMSQSLDGNRLSLDAELADGSRAIFIYDIAGRRIVARFAVRTR